MKVLYLSKALVVAAYREKIRALGEHVDVHAVMPTWWGGEPPEPSVEGLPEPTRDAVFLSGHNHLHVYRRPGRRLRAAAPDLVHVDEEPYSLVTWQLAGRCRRAGVPFVFFGWQNIERRLPPPFGWVRRRVYRTAAGGIAGTAAAARLLVATGFDGPLVVIPQFGVDPDRFAPSRESRVRIREELDIPLEAPVVGYGGRLVPEKGVALLLDAFARLSPGEAAVAPHLMLLGDGPEREALEEAARRAGVRDRVRFIGHVASLTVPAHLAAMDLLVLPTTGSSTWSEQFGRILVEGMACGLPVVATDHGEIPDVVGDVGVLVPPGDRAALLSATTWLLEDPGRRRALGEAGRTRVLERYTHRRIAERTVSFYRRVMGGDATAEAAADATGSASGRSHGGGA